MLEAAYITVSMVAVCQELEKPEKEREWHGRVGVVPYDFRFPTIKRIKDAFWNPEDTRIFTPHVFGIGWAVNLFALVDKIRTVQECYATEEDFLMPTESLRKVLQNRPVIG